MKSYVDWFEQKGISVLPIPFDTKQPDLYFRMVNGLFLPGTDRGYDVKNDAFMHTLRIFIELSKQKGEYFPIWGTCFGMEVLLDVIGGCPTLKHYPAEGYYPIRMTRDASHSRLIGSFPPSYLRHLEQTPSTLQNHEYGIAIKDMKKGFSVLATSLDEYGREYVAIIESKKYPIYAVQFHPEVDAHSPFLDFLHSELQKNHHSCCQVPRLATIFKSRKCIQYEKGLCYYF